MAASEQGTIKPAPNFNAETDSETLSKAMKGAGTDEKAIIDVLTKRSSDQRQEIFTKYKSMYGRDLVDDLKSELSGNFRDVIVSLMRPKSRFDAISLRKAMKGLGTDEEVLIEVICTKTNSEIESIKTEYKAENDRDLEKDIVSETSGHFKQLLVSLLQAKRDESTTVDAAKAQADAQALYDAGEARWGTDESKFNEIFATRSYAHLQKVFQVYPTVSKKNRSITDAIKGEMSGDIQNGMLAIVGCVQSRPTYFAEKLYKTMKGLGTKDDTLIRIVVSRSEIDLGTIKQIFKDKYGKTLHEFIHGDTSGDYRNALLSIVGN
ncbi:annexin-B12-like [Dysidea avara]|uniref:annexin-B12-like n=1 Tax=Dysidea avara TaxID=196820 RepID=UPI00331937A6